MGRIRALSIALQLQRYMRSICPYDTGNMHDTIHHDIINANECTVTIGGEDAPYAVYTNERWIAPRWRGRDNPNEKWIDSGVHTFAILLAQQLKGDLSTRGTEERWENKAYYDRIERDKQAAADHAQ